jgi:hypothetical protein
LPAQKSDFNWRQNFEDAPVAPLAQLAGIGSQLAASWQLFFLPM